MFVFSDVAIGVSGARANKLLLPAGKLPWGDTAAYECVMTADGFIHPATVTGPHRDLYKSPKIFPYTDEGIAEAMLYNNLSTPNVWFTPDFYHVPVNSAAELLNIVKSRGI